MKPSSSRMSFLGLLLVLAAIVDISIAMGNSLITIPLEIRPFPPATGTHSSSKPGPIDENSLDIQWLAAIQVGTPGQTSKLLVDSGSSNFFITTTRCDGTCLEFFQGSNLVDTSLSTSFSSHPGSYIYGFGGGVGLLYNVCSDIIVLGDSSSFNQSFLSATFNIVRAPIYFDGILGMAFGTITKPSGMTTLEILKNLNKINALIFSVELIPTRLGGGGELIFGGYDEKKIKGDPSWTPVTTPYKLWDARVSDVGVGNKDLQVGANFIFDTGSEFILAPCQIVTLIYDALPGSILQPNGNWTIPCKLAYAKTPDCDVKFKIAGKWWSIPIIDFIVDYHIDLNGRRTDYCVGGAQIHPTLNVLGVPFLKTVNVIFDAERNQIGIGERIKSSY